MKKVPLNKATRIINHGPLVIVSSEYSGKATFTPVAWNMPVEHTPPLIAVCVGKGNYLNYVIKKSGAFCLNIPGPKMKKLALDLGSVSGKEVCKVKKFNLQLAPCSKIKCSYLKESSAVIECVLIKKVSVDKIDIFIGEALFARADSALFKNNIWDASKAPTIHHLGGGSFSTDKAVK